MSDALDLALFFADRSQADAKNKAAQRKAKRAVAVEWHGYNADLGAHLIKLPGMSEPKPLGVTLTSGGLEVGQGVDGAPKGMSIAVDWLPGQRPQPVEEEQSGTTSGVVYAISAESKIIIGGDRAEPVVIEIEAAFSFLLQVQRVRRQVIVLWTLNGFSVERWINGTQISLAQTYPHFAGGGYLESRVLSTGASGTFNLRSPDDLVTTASFSGTVEGGVANYSGQRIIGPNLTRPFSTQQIDGDDSITGSYDVHQLLLMRNDGRRSLAMHRQGSISTTARSQSADVYIVDENGNEQAVNSSPGLLIPIPQITPVVGVTNLSPDWKFKNYITDEQRPIFAALIGMNVVIAARADGTVTKGFGTIVSYSASSDPEPFGGTTTLNTVQMNIERVITVPFDAATFDTSTDEACVLYSNTGSIIDLLLQSQIYRYNVGPGSNLVGLGEAGDLNGKIPLAHFNHLDNSLVDGSPNTQWIRSTVFVGETRRNIGSLIEATAAYADEWRLQLREGIMSFIKRDRPVRSRRSAVLQPDVDFGAVSSAFYTS